MLAFEWCAAASTRVRQLARGAKLKPACAPIINQHGTAKKEQNDLYHLNPQPTINHSQIQAQVGPPSKLSKNIRSVRLSECLDCGT